MIPGILPGFFFDKQEVPGTKVKKMRNLKTNYFFLKPRTKCQALYEKNEKMAKSLAILCYNICECKIFVRR